MSTSLRIEELKKKFDENPRRYFAPLANEYRKAGDLQQAISICQAHLPQQPGHMSGHIVYGQALFEAKQFDQARTVFETALALDPENLIALRYLGDIAFELGDRTGARTWYTRVLETDPRNEEIAALMAAMGEDRSTSREVPAVAAPPQPQAAAASAAPSPATAPEATGQKAVEPPAARAEEKATGAAGSTSTADAELEKLFSSPSARAADEAAPAAPPPLGFSPLSGFDDSKPGGAPPSLNQPAPSLEKAAGNALGRPTFDVQRGDDTPLQNPPEQPAQTSGLPATVGAAGRDAGFMTETMAELYLKQGFHDRALDVYRQLVAQNPADRGLRERMERVEREMRGSAGARGAGLGAATSRSGPGDGGGRGRTTVRQFLAGLGTRGVTGRGPGVVPPPGGGPRTSGEFRIPPERPERPARAATGSIDALFAGAAASREDTAAASALADAFPAGAASGAGTDSQIGGRPAHPAATELSLDHVFRDGGSPPPPSGRAPATVSYDQFFSQPGASAGAGSQEPGGGGAPPSGADDIEQFNAWLQGLKKR
jgi:tetratricopeptide (TPR) repeat protein